MNKFSVIPSNHSIWNQEALLEFLIANQGQDIVLEVREAPCCNTIGLYNLLEKFHYQNVTIHTCNHLESHAKFNIVAAGKAFSFFRVNPNADYTKFHTWNLNQKFGCFYNRPLWYRIGLAATLQHDYPDQSVINVRCSPQDYDDRLLFEVQQLFMNNPESHWKFAAVSPTWPRQLEPVDTYGFCSTNEHTDQLAQFYPNFLIDIVAETFVHGQTFFVTEKTIRPMLLKKPFIAMAAQDHLLYLRQMGFKTFSEFWDEDYDGVSDTNRYNKILELIDCLSKKSNQELEKMYSDMQHILDHNYNLLTTQQFSTKIQKCN